MKRFYFFIGTTAEFIKLSPVIRELKKRKIKFTIITSGQNGINFGDLRDFTGNIAPNIELQKKTSKSSIFGFLLWSLKTIFLLFKRLSKELKDTERDKFYLIIHGDTISSLIGALVGKSLGVKIVQIESGLRSFNIFEPVPEEICRLLITKIASMHFAPNSWALKNLDLADGVKVNTYENTLVESCLWAANKKTDSKYIKGLKNYYILFIHRQEHVYFNQNRTWDIIKITMDSAPKKLSCILVMHALTSRILTPQKIDALSQTRNNLIILPKLPYVDYINLMRNAEFIATDSCTSQEEAYYLGIPYLGLRNLTERTEGLGQNVIISKGDKTTIRNFLANYKKYKKPLIKSDSKPSRIVVKYLLNS